MKEEVTGARIKPAPWLGADQPVHSGTAAFSHMQANLEMCRNTSCVAPHGCSCLVCSFLLRIKLAKFIKKILTSHHLPLSLLLLFFCGDLRQLAVPPSAGWFCCPIRSGSLWLRLQTAVVVHKGFLPMTLIVFGNNGLAEWLTEVSHLAPYSTNVKKIFLRRSLPLRFPLPFRLSSLPTSHSVCVSLHYTSWLPHMLCILSQEAGPSSHHQPAPLAGTGRQAMSRKEMTSWYFWWRLGTREAAYSQFMEASIGCCFFGSFFNDLTFHW